MDKTTFTLGDVIVVKPNGQTVGATSVTEVGLNRFHIAFAAQTIVNNDPYRVKVGPDVRDLAGHQLDQDRDGNFGEATDDVYDARFKLVPVDLGLSIPSVTPTALVAGEAVSVSWNGANQTGVPLIGDWTDGVYLSRDAVWDIGDVLLGTVRHTGGLVQDEPYPGALTALVPGTLPGDYRILVRADIANQERETNEANNLGVSSPLTLTVRSLTNGVAASGTLTPGNRSAYYAVYVNAGDSLALVLDGLTASGVNELYASFGSIPTRNNFDFGALKDDRFLNRQDQTLAFTAPPGGGTYYVLIYGDEITGSTPFTLSGTVGSLVVTSLTPTRSGNSQSATVTLEGAGFDLGTTVKFIGVGNVERVPTAIHLISPSALTLDLDLPNWTPQTYAVRVTKGTTTIETAQPFEVLAGGKSDLQTKLLIPNNLAVRGKQTLWLEYKNAGTAPMTAPVLRVTGDHSTLITLDVNLASRARQTAFQGNWPPRGITSKVEVMGTGSGATPGILQPGDSARIPIYYVGLDKDSGVFFGQSVFLDGGFSVGEITPDAVSRTASTRSPIYDAHGVLIGWHIVETSVDYSIGWNGPGVPAAAPAVPGAAAAVVPTLQEQMRPESIPADAWAAIWQNLSVQIGNEYAHYDAKLAEDTTYLHGLGQTVNDVSSLWGYEITQANAGLGPVQVLAGAVDASVVTPGLGLSFSRVFGNSILARYRQGAFGRGWTSNWDIRAEVGAQGDVVLRGPGGADRFFTLDQGSYRGAPGDFGVLTNTGSGVRLTETDQTIWQFRSDGRLEFVQDTNGNKITAGYNGTGLTSLTHSSGQQLLIAYNGAGHITSITDPVGPGSADDRIPTFQYDGTGEHLMQVTAPGNRVTRYTYDAGAALPTRHALFSVESADHTHAFFAYDARRTARADRPRRQRAAGDLCLRHRGRRDRHRRHRTPDVSRLWSRRQTRPGPRRAGARRELCLR